MSKSKFYKFDGELEEGVIVARPNRFVMEIVINGKKEKAHCPVTGKIGHFVFKDVPCLVSPSDNPKRKTKFTVEAISPQRPSAKRKQWIGINQGKSNNYVAFFLENNFFPKMIKGTDEVKREKNLRKSRIDFKVGKTFVEVKTLVNNIPFGSPGVEQSPVTSVDRLIKHFSDLASYVKKENGKAIVLLCNQYKADRFQPPQNSQNTKVGRTVKRATLQGVENWQVNLKFTKKGVYFIEYFKLNLF